MKYKIQLSTQDQDIPKEISCLYIEADIPLKDIVEHIENDFLKFDVAEGIAEKFREEYGWGTEGFLAYLSFQHTDWKIMTVYFSPDATIDLVGH